MQKLITLACFALVATSLLLGLVSASEAHAATPALVVIWPAR